MLGERGVNGIKGTIILLYTPFILSILFSSLVLLAQLCVRRRLEQHVFLCPFSKLVGGYDVL